MTRAIHKGFEMNPNEVKQGKDPIKESQDIFGRDMQGFYDNLENARLKNLEDPSTGITHENKIEWKEKLDKVVQIDNEIRQLIQSVYEGKNIATCDDIHFKNREDKVLAKIAELHTFLNNSGFFDVDSQFNVISHKGRSLWSKHNPDTAERLADENNGITMESTLGGQLFTNQKNWGLEYVPGPETTPARCFWAGMSKHAANLLKDTVHVYTYGNPIPGTSFTDDELQPLFQKMKDGEVKKVKIHIFDPIEIKEDIPIFLSQNVQDTFSKTHDERYIINTNTGEVIYASPGGNAQVLEPIEQKAYNEKVSIANEVFKTLEDEGRLKIDQRLEGGGSAVQAAHLLISSCKGHRVGIHLVERKTVLVTTEHDVRNLLRHPDKAFKVSQHISYGSGEEFKKVMKEIPSQRKPTREVQIDPQTAKPAPWLDQSLFGKSAAELRILSKKKHKIARNTASMRESRIKETLDTDQELLNKPQVFSDPTSLTINPPGHGTTQFVLTLPNEERIGVNVKLRNGPGVIDNVAKALKEGLAQITNSIQTVGRLDIYYGGGAKGAMMHDMCDKLTKELAASHVDIQIYTHAFRKKVDGTLKPIIMEDKETPEYTKERPKLG